MLYVIKLVFEMVNANFFRMFDGNALIVNTLISFSFVCPSHVSHLLGKLKVKVSTF